MSEFFNCMGNGEAEEEGEKGQVQGRSAGTYGKPQIYALSSYYHRTLLSAGSG